MKRLVLAASIAVLLAAAVVPALAQNAKRPVVLLFETNKGEGADTELAAATTKALRLYFRQTEKVEAAAFDRESPTVLRAIMEKRLTPDQVASYSSRDQRLLVASTLGFDYAAGSEISIKTGSIEVKLWVGQVRDKKGSWESTGYARAMGSDAFNMSNSMQSAASAAVVDIARKAFNGLPVVPQPDAADGTESTAIAQQPAPQPPTATDYEISGDAHTKDGNLAQAIQDYSRAVSADPSNAALRIKLAEAYGRKGIYDQAYAELGRATMAGADQAAVDAAKDRIARIQSGEQAPVATDPAPPAPQPPTNGEPSTASLNAAADAVAKMVDGDRLWTRGQPDEAAEAYRQSIKLNPSDWRAHERLAVVDASMALFDESRRALEQLKVVQPKPSAAVIANRYDMLRKAFDKHFAGMLRQYQSDSAAFEKHEITRESYYTSIKSMAERLETMTQFLDAIPTPESKQSANLRRSLACGLMAQAATNLLDYLETNNTTSKANADVFVLQAEKETETAAKMEAGGVASAE